MTELPKQLPTIPTFEAGMSRRAVTAAIATLGAAISPSRANALDNATIPQGAPNQGVLAALAASGGSSLVGFQQAGTGAVARPVNGKLREAVSIMDFGAVCDGVADDTAEVQATVDYAIANQLDVIVPRLTRITAPINIDRLVDTAIADNYFTISSSSGGGFIVDSAITIFSTTLVNGSNSDHPVSQMIKFVDLKFESTDAALAAYVLDQNKLFRLIFDGCNFRKIKCLLAPANKFTQTITFQNCQARRWQGSFYKSEEISYDLKVLGGLWEAGGNAFEMDYPVGCAFIGANIEGMTNFAIKYRGANALTISGCYFEANGLGGVGCSIDGSEAVGIIGGEAITITGNFFAGDDALPANAQVKWGDNTAAVSSGNHCTTTLHDFVGQSRVNIYGDYARTALSAVDTSSQSAIRNHAHIGTVYRAEGQYTFGGIVRSEFIGGQGGYLRLRSLQDKIESTHGLNINPDGTAEATQDLIVRRNVNAEGEYRVDNVKVVGNQGAAVPDATDAATAVTQLNELLARLRTHGLIAS